MILSGQATDFIGVSIAGANRERKDGEKLGKFKLQVSGHRLQVASSV